MLLLEKFHELLRPWRSVCAQQRTWQRAQRLAYALKSVDSTESRGHRCR